MIPEDWSVVRLSVLISELNAGVSVNSVNEKLGLYGHTESVLKTSCILDGYFFPDECKKILPGDIGRAKLNPTKDSIVISRMNTPALVGECGYVDKDYSYLFLPDRLWQTIIRKEAGVNVRWLAYLLSFGQFSKAIKDTATGTSGSMKNISKETFLGLQVIFPDKREQTAIANALSDADALIQSLTRLIAKKRQIKQGAMQTLLTGKKRLPMFVKSMNYQNTDIGIIPEDWDCVAMGDIGQSLIGLTYNPSNVKDYGTLVLRSSNVQGGQLAFENNVFVDMELPKRVMVEPDDILICVRNGSRQLIGKCALIDDRVKGAAFGAFMSVYRSKYSRFIFYQFQSHIIQKQIEEVMGATINQITNKDLSVFKVALPKSEEEQTYIATILSDMDAEIAALEAKLAKYRHIKQGMMQNLLTGRIRLI